MNIFSIKWVSEDGDINLNNRLKLSEKVHVNATYFFKVLDIFLWIWFRKYWISNGRIHLAGTLYKEIKPLKIKASAMWCLAGNFTTT